MSELEKKYSDFQETECKEEQLIQVVDEKICPTCNEDPNFKLRAEWFEIPEAYLNKKVCEYHVLVYEREAVRESGDPKIILNTDELEKFMFEIAALRILREFDKPINAGTKQRVVNASYIVDDYLPPIPGQLGRAYLIGVPAFNFDQVV